MIGYERAYGKTAAGLQRTNPCKIDGLEGFSPTYGHSLLRLTNWSERRKFSGLKVLFSRGDGTFEDSGIP